MIRYTAISCRTALSPSRLPGLDYSLNPYSGCEHGCLYCYSPSIIRRFDETWGEYVEMKINIAQALTKDLAEKRLGTVGLSTVTDPYQPIEKSVELSRRCLEILTRTRFRICIQTKSNLVTRDLDLMKPESCELGVTITTLDAFLAEKLEPRAPPPDARAQALIEAARKNIPTWIFLGPIIPFLTDDETNLNKIFLLAQKTNTSIIYDKLNLKPTIMQRLRPLLDQEQIIPDLNQHLKSDSEYQDRLLKKMGQLSRRYGVPVEQAFDKPLKIRQMTLF